MDVMCVTLSSAQSPMSWLKAEASLNMKFIFVTLSTCQPLSGWLKDEAL